MALQWTYLPFTDNSQFSPPAIKGEDQKVITIQLNFDSQGYSSLYVMLFSEGL